MDLGNFFETFFIRFIALFLIGFVTLSLPINSRLTMGDNSATSSTEHPNEEVLRHRIVRRSVAFGKELRVIKNIEKKFETKYIQTMFRFDRFDRRPSIISPLSAFIPLFVLSFGAQGPTRSKFNDAIGIAHWRTSLAKHGFRRFVKILTHHNLHMATKIYYPASSLQPSSQFFDMASYYLQTTMESIDLEDEHIPSEKINQWLSNQTNSRSDVTLYEPYHIRHNGKKTPVQLLGPDPVMLIASVVYFKGVWKTGFDVSHTSLRPFTKFNGRTINTPTMYNHGRYQYGHLPELQSRWVKLPFKSTFTSTSVNMFVILPNTLKSYRNLIARLEVINVRDLYHTGSMTDVHLYLPKFRVERNISLHDWLPTFLGESASSESPATFAKIFTNSPEVRLGPSQSRAVVEIDETGTVSEQASGYFYRPRKPRAIVIQNSVEFKVDHSFIAIIATGGDIVLNLFTINFSGGSA